MMKWLISTAATLALVAAPDLAFGVSHRETMKIPEQAPGTAPAPVQTTEPQAAPADPTAGSGSSAAPVVPGTGPTAPSAADPTTNRDPQLLPGEQTRRPGRGGR
jgi:hypothetical protein